MSGAESGDAQLCDIARCATTIVATRDEALSGGGKRCVARNGALSSGATGRLAKR